MREGWLCGHLRGGKNGDRESRVTKFHLQGRDRIDAKKLLKAHMYTHPPQQNLCIIILKSSNTGRYVNYKCIQHQGIQIKTQAQDNLNREAGNWLYNLK